jgi:hypothetical protein
MHANIHTYKIQQYYSQIIKSTQQHIIKYKSHHSSHSYILSQFPIQYTTHLNTARKATYPQGNNTQVLEPLTLDLPLTLPVMPHTLDLPLTPTVKPHTRRANK